MSEEITTSDEREEERMQLSLLLANNAAIAEKALRADIKKEKQCIDCGTKTHNRGYFVPTRPEEIAALKRGGLYLYPICEKCIAKTQADAAEEARVDRLVLRDAIRLKRGG